MNLSSEIKITQVITATTGAAGTTDINSTILDMKGYEGVMWIVAMGAIVANAVTSIKAQQDTDSAFGSDPQDLAGTGMTIADDDDNQVFVLDLVKPRERYVRLVVDRGTQNATVQSAIAIQYGPRERPQSLTVTDAVTYERHISPAEGTA